MSMLVWVSLCRKPRRQVLSCWGPYYFMKNFFIIETTDKSKKKLCSHGLSIHTSDVLIIFYRNDDLQRSFNTQPVIRSTSLDKPLPPSSQRPSTARAILGVPSQPSRIRRSLPSVPGLPPKPPGAPKWKGNPILLWIDWIEYYYHVIG